MRVVVLRSYGSYSVGAVIPEMPANQARTLIARGLVRQEEAAPVKRAMKAPTNRMVSSPIQKQD